MKNLLRGLKLNELSLVDRGANKGARVTLFKRDPIDPEPLVEVCKGLFDDDASDSFREALADELKRQRVMEVNDKLFPLFEALRESIMTSAAELSGEDRDAKVRENVEEFLSAMRGKMNALAEKAGTHVAGSPGTSPTASNGDDIMSEELEKKVGELETKIADLTKQAEGLNEERDTLKADLEKVLEATGAKLEKSEDGETEVKLEKAEETVEINGEQVAKSDVPEPVLKAIEKQNAEIAKMRERQEREDLAKRAESELPNLSGKPDEKGQLLKAIDGIEDEDVRKGVLESLKAADTAVSKLFAEVGKTVADDDSSATHRLEKMARDYAEEKSLSYEQAFAKVIDTPEGRELRKQSDAERRAQ